MIFKKGNIFVISPILIEQCTLGNENDGNECSITFPKKKKHISMNLRNNKEMEITRTD